MVRDGRQVKKLAVVIPYYRGEKYIADTVDSVVNAFRNSKYSALSITIVDDASYPPFDRRSLGLISGNIEIKTIRNAFNRGTLGSRIAGLSGVCDECDLHLIDQDDYVLPGFYDNDGSSGQICVFNYFIEQGHVMRTRFKCPRCSVEKQLNGRDVYLRGGNPIHSIGTILFQYTTVPTVKQYFNLFESDRDISGSDDAFLLLFLLDKHFHVSYFKECQFVYRLHETNQSSRIGIEFLDQTTKAIDKLAQLGFLSPIDFENYRAYEKFRRAYLERDPVKILRNFKAGIMYRVLKIL